MGAAMCLSKKKFGEKNNFDEKIDCSKMAFVA
jgi:hypothetical protein